ncbi:MAG: hypothetical protein Q9178_005598 [Gyalolechia marmorata]
MAPPSDFPAPHIIQPTKSHHHTIIALHGRGSNGLEFADELFEDKTSKGLTIAEHFPHSKWIFLSSPKRHSTAFQEDLDQWFDIYSLTDPSTQEELQIEGLRDSIKHILDIISKEVEFVPPSNIVLLGISQGCATAIHALLAGQYRLGGFIGIAGWMSFHKQVADLSKLYSDTLQLPSTIRSQANNATSVLLCHCTDDDVVDINLGHQLRDALMAPGLNMDITFKEFAKGAHWIPSPLGFDAIVEFLRSRNLD